MERDELLMREYETISTQIVHWDSLFWNMSQFFVAVEAVLLAVVGQRLASLVVDNSTIHTGLFLVLLGVAIFNLLLNYVWFRANRSCREYLIVRFWRALQIEEDPAMGGVVQLYQFQQSTLKDAKHAKHSSSWWQIHLPTLFMVAWIAMLVAALFDYGSMADAVVPGVVAGSAVGLTFAAVAFIEKTGWPLPIRAIVSPPSEEDSVCRQEIGEGS